MLYYCCDSPFYVSVNYEVRILFYMRVKGRLTHLENVTLRRELYYKVRSYHLYSGMDVCIVVVFDVVNVLRTRTSCRWFQPTSVPLVSRTPLCTTLDVGWPTTKTLSVVLSENFELQKTEKMVLYIYVRSFFYGDF